MAQILDAASVKSAQTQNLNKFYLEMLAQKITPTLQVLLLGEDPASIIYTQNKKRFIEQLGGQVHILKLPQNTTKEKLLQHISNANLDENIHGILVQLPLPIHLQDLDFQNYLNPKKDVDGLSALSSGLVFQNRPNALLPCTPMGIMSIFRHYNISLKSAHVAIVGRSYIVGRPMSLIALNNDATVTICHGQTKNLAKITKEADIVIAAIGKAEFFDNSYFRNDQSQTVIDVGINKNHHGQLCGDVKFNEVSNMVKAITPVPGGVGPMTIFSLAQNLIQAINLLKRN